MKCYSVKVDKSGRILIPVDARRQLHLVEGESDVLLTVDDTGLSVSTRRQALAKIRARLREYIPEGADLSGELLADRRREAAEENVR